MVEIPAASHWPALKFSAATRSSVNTLILAMTFQRLAIKAKSLFYYKNHHFALHIKKAQ